MLKRKKSEKSLNSSKGKLKGKLKRMHKSGKDTLLESLEFSKDVEEEEYQSPKRKKATKAKKEVDIDRIVEEKNELEERVIELEEEIQVMTVDQQN